MDHGADTNATANDAYTPLMAACFHGHAFVTKLLLDRGCNVNAVKSGFVNGCNTALHRACYCGNTECVKELLDHGADTSIMNNAGRTPLDVARESKQKAVIVLILEEKKRTKQDKMNREDDDKAAAMLNLISLDAKVTESVASTSRERLSSPMVETIIDQRCDRLKCDMIDSQSEAMKKLTSDLEAKIEQSINHRSALLEDKISQSFETLTNQLTISNGEVAKCISHLSTRVGHLSSQVDANEEIMKQLCKKRKRTSMECEGDAVSDVTTVGGIFDDRSHQHKGDLIEKEPFKALNVFKRFCKRG